MGNNFYKRAGVQEIFAKRGRCRISLNKYIATVLAFEFIVPMRKNLKDKVGERKKFKALVSRFGKKVNYAGHTDITILLTKIIDNETTAVVTDHQWFSFTKGFEKAQLKAGDTVEFEARVKMYKKGYVSRKLSINKRQSDYKLSHPTNVQVSKNSSLRLVI